MDNVRILKGYSKDEQKELKKVKETLRIDDLLHIITGFTQDTRCVLILRKYNNAEKDEQISIIRDILDFYTDKAKFAEELYVVHDKATDQYIYCGMTQLGLCWGQPHSDIAEIHTKEEWLTFNPAYEPMLERL